MGPLLFLLYTADMLFLADRHGINIHCYADDGQLYLYRVQRCEKGCWVYIQNWCLDLLQSIKIKLRQSAIHLARNSATAGQNKYSDNQSRIICSATSIICLGVISDRKLSMKETVDKISRSAFYYLRQLRVIPKSLTTKACEALVHAFVSSRLEYCYCLHAIRYWRNTVELTTVRSLRRRPSRAWQTQVWLDLCRYTRQTSLASREAKNRVQDLRSRFQVQIQRGSSLPLRDAAYGPTPDE